MAENSDYDIDKLQTHVEENPQRLIGATQARRLYGFPNITFYRWRKIGRLECLPHNQKLTTTALLLRAIENANTKSRKAS